MSNEIKGRNSYDSTSTGQSITFFNRNVSEYPTEVSSPKFDLVPVEKQKDLMINTARMHAKQEYDRIMQLVDVLQKQAQGIMRRLEITDMVYQAEYKFQVFPGKIYWLINDARQDKIILGPLGPHDWASGVPRSYTYLAKVKYLGDQTWTEVDDNDNPVY